MSFNKPIKINRPIRSANLVSSSVVLGCDHFKSFVASLKGLFGGNISVYESVMDRGRREAILRIREQALRQRANILVNVKIETVMLSPLGTSEHPQVCVTAYGTAISYEK